MTWSHVLCSQMPHASNVADLTYFVIIKTVIECANCVGRNIES